MICIRFPDKPMERQALGWLAGRFSFKTFATGEILVPAEALGHLAMEGIKFIVEGRATYQQMIASVQSARLE
jgi:hypothetical protein